MVAGLPESRRSAFALRRAHFHALGLPNGRTQLLDQCRVLLEFLDPFFFLLRDVEAAIPNVEGPRLDAQLLEVFPECHAGDANFLLSGLERDKCWLISIDLLLHEHP